MYGVEIRESLYLPVLHIDEFGTKDYEFVYEIAKVKMRQPGIEPGSTAWKAAMLTTIPPTLLFKG